MQRARSDDGRKISEEKIAKFILSDKTVIRQCYEPKGRRNVVLILRKLIENITGQKVEEVDPDYKEEVMINLARKKKRGRK